MWYLCGLGSNVGPERNISRTLSRLMNEARWLWVSEIIRTQPVGMQSTNYFLNALVAFWSSEKHRILKLRLNALEEELGRDRSDTERSRKDHTIDIDILECKDRPWFTGRDISETYFRNLFEGHLDSTGIPVSIEFGRHTLGKTPVTIRRIRDTGRMAVSRARELDSRIDFKRGLQGLGKDVPIPGTEPVHYADSAGLAVGHDVVQS